ncbi:MAG: ADP-ribosylglycohydrolase family protein [uncultured Rubrobacteraceae bacterium]|uniref:protein-tyrosine-phosphatase n=1 Tax=uncultured Rubrobacteraceae bacterium TaxID=349277 RepID=A0A6J4SU77_9ACTN|nr:MAG: ADP-ribosylglycohydrolase family protein [uncultured Rubrobacteraceae bacterium]
MSTYLLTWNPNRWQWEDLREMADVVAEVGSVTISWSCGNTKKIEEGDRAFLLRQGVEPRGIIAPGTVVTLPYEAPHWDPDISEPALYVDVRLDALLDPEAQDILWREVLDEPHLSGMHWNAQSSGTTIPEPVADAPEREWDTLIGRSSTSTRATSETRTRNSESHPIRVDFLDEDATGLPGRLGMTILPGVRDPGRWNRDLEDDLHRLKWHYAADALVTLLEREEFETYGVPGLPERTRQTGLEMVHFPIVDVSTPRKAQSDEYAALIDKILALLRAGKTVVVHCRGGLGRTGTVVASVLVALGRDPDDAIDAVRGVRSDRAVETPEQEEYVRNVGKNWRKGLRRTSGGQAGGPTQLERYRGCLLGLAAGDALGTALEFKRPGTFRTLSDMVGGGPFALAPGEWTDDTSMALCLAESLIERRAFDPTDQLQRYVRWYREGHMSATGECFDIGNATREALHHFESTGDPYSGSADPDRAGNGSIMRLAPVPLFYAMTATDTSGDAALRPSEALDRCAESSRTTHGAPAAVDACRYLGALIIGAVSGTTKEELLSERYAPVQKYWEDHPLTPEIDTIASGSFKRKEPPEIRGRGYVVASLEAALWAFYKSHSFEQGALLAVNLGEDAGTTGAVYGQLAGAHYGEKSIPKPWRRKLAHRLLIEHFAEKLYYLAHPQ